MAGVLTGVGTATFLDEAVFHQLLHWHHFYDRGTPTAGLVSDGLLHAASTFALVAGLFLVADLRRRGPLPRRLLAGAYLLGLGGFQLFDGLVDHKLLRVHQIRYHVTLWPYDLAWNAIALLLLAAGLLALRPSRAAAPR